MDSVIIPEFLNHDTGSSSGQYLFVTFVTGVSFNSREAEPQI